MNKIYRLVWNSAQHAWIVAGEFAGARGKGTSTLRKAKRVGGLAGIAAASLIAFPADARDWVTYDTVEENSVGDWGNMTLGYNAQGDFMGTVYDSTTRLGGTGIHNLAVGVNGGDAVNLDQLNDTNRLINDIDIAGTKYFHANSTGADSSATGVDAVAIGPNAQTSGNVAISMGANAQALSDETLALGNNSSATGLAALALGSESKANGQWTIAIGNLTEATGDNAIAIGAKSKANTAGATALGNFAEASGMNALSLGNYAISSGLGSAAIGPGAHANDIRAVAIGDTSEANGQDSVSIGAGSNSSEFSVAAGANSAATGAYSTALGANATASQEDAIAIGHSSVANGDSSIAMGDEAVASNTRASAFGYKANATGSHSLALGENALASAHHSTAVGEENEATNEYASAFGSLSNATGVESLAMGHRATSSGNGSTSIGFHTLSEGFASTAIGYSTDANGAESTAVGSHSRAQGDYTLALGRNATAVNEGDVALGSGSNTDVVVETTGTMIAGKTYDFAGSSPTSTVSIGNVGTERTLTNLAAGRLSESSTDGVNGSQLFATNSAIEALDTGTVHYDTNVDGTNNYNSITLGGDTYNSTTHTGGTKITNVADGTDPSDAVNFSQLTETNNSINNIYTSGTKYFHANSTGTDSSATGIDAVAIGMGAIADVARSVALGDGAKTETAVGTTGTTILGKDYTFAGTAPVGTVSIGKAGEERTLTNVAAGRLSETSTDAVNGSQLYATNTALNNITTNMFNLDDRAVKYDTNGDGTTNHNSITLGGDTYNSSTHTGGTKITNVAEGDINATSSDAVNGSQLYNIAGDTSETYITNNGRGVRYVRTNDTGLSVTDAHAQGQASTAVGYNATSSGVASVAIGQDASASALSSIAIGKGAQATTDNSVALGDGAKTSAAAGTNSVVIQGNEYQFAGTSPTGTVSVGDTGAERTITNVAAGALSSTSTDAVNGSQLYATVVAINNINTGISDLGDAAVKYDKNTDGTVNYNKVTLGGGPTTITNLAAGTQDNDAVNYSQLKAVTETVTNISNGTDGMFQVNNTSKLPKPVVTGKDAAAGGAGAVASGENSLAIGTRSSATAKNSVALGADSVANRANTVSVGSVGAERQITNVAAGTQGTDAVNVNQLKSGISSANQYTDNKFNSLKNMVDDQGNKLSAGIAGAMAMAGLPQAYQPGASMVGIAGSTYQDQSAVALGVSVISDNGKWVTKLSGTTNSQGDLGGAVGVGYQW
ncbi:YadA-like family protein [Buttiauxella noackiae]|uniref:YadA-like family protein n=1 Tax=Buttiauxella noackiae TaxID=82992 RepID=UPI0035A6DB34